MNEEKETRSRTPGIILLAFFLLVVCPTIFQVCEHNSKDVEDVGFQEESTYQ